MMLLAASTALSKDTPSYQMLRRFMMVSGAALTGLHVLIAFTPLYYFVAVNILGAPAEIIEPGRIGYWFCFPTASKILIVKSKSQGISKTVKVVGNVKLKN